jgi:hypothetical protein
LWKPTARASVSPSAESIQPWRERRRKASAFDARGPQPSDAQLRDVDAALDGGDEVVLERGEPVRLPAQRGAICVALALQPSRIVAHALEQPPHAALIDHARAP